MRAVFFKNRDRWVATHGTKTMLHRWLEKIGKLIQNTLSVENNEQWATSIYFVCVFCICAGSICQHRPTMQVIQSELFDFVVGGRLTFICWDEHGQANCLFLLLVFSPYDQKWLKIQLWTRSLKSSRRKNNWWISELGEVSMVVFGSPKKW